MTSPNGSVLDKTERINQLKKRAEAVLAQAGHDLERPLSDTQNLQAVKLLEELRIYQVELELQNEELTSAQLDLEIAHKRYEHLFAHLPIAALVVDDKGTIDNCNDMAQALLGQGKLFDRTDNRLWSKLVQDDRTRLRSALHDVTPGRAEVLPGISLAQDPSRRVSFDAHLIGLTIDYKLDRRILLLLVDRSAETARREDQQFYEQLLNSSDAFIYAFDLEGKALMANKSLLHFVGRRLDQVKGHAREDFLPVRDAILHMEADKQVLQSERACQKFCVQGITFH